MNKNELQLWEAIFGGKAFGNDADAEYVDYSEEAKATLRQVLYTLTPREEIVLRRRFGIDCEQETRGAIGRSLSVGPRQIRPQKPCITAVRVGQIEAKALRKMRHPSRARVLAPHAIRLGLDHAGLASLLVEEGP